jgi:DNA-binding CsgD family transcriptional regulator
MEVLGLSLEIVLDSLPDGTVVVDRDARVLHANRPARELLARARHGAQGSGRLQFPHAATQAAFERALRQPGEFLVHAPDGEVVARASVQALSRNPLRPEGEGTLLLCLRSLPRRTRVHADSLRGLYGLTPAEARVAAGLVGSSSLRELAYQLELSENTVKSHLKRVFRKCDVQSTVELSALVATGPRTP